SLNPSIPAAWTSFTFRILYRGSVLEVTVGKDELNLTVTEGEPVKLTVFGKDVTAKPTGLTVPMPADRVAR
ncbi:MAG: glycosyl hydrolase family 65 protein, partial [Planctomycetota bacterium]